LLLQLWWVLFLHQCDRLERFVRHWTRRVGGRACTIGTNILLFPDRADSSTARKGARNLFQKIEASHRFIWTIIRCCFCMLSFPFLLLPTSPFLSDCWRLHSSCSSSRRHRWIIGIHDWEMRRQLFCWIQRLCRFKVHVWLTNHESQRLPFMLLLPAHYNKEQEQERHLGQGYVQQGVTWQAGLHDDNNGSIQVCWGVVVVVVVVVVVAGVVLKSVCLWLTVAIFKKEKKK